MYFFSTEGKVLKENNMFPKNPECSKSENMVKNQNQIDFDF